MSSQRVPLSPTVGGWASCRPRPQASACTGHHWATHRAVEGHEHLLRGGRGPGAGTATVPRARAPPDEVGALREGPSELPRWPVSWQATSTKPAWRGVTHGLPPCGHGHQAQGAPWEHREAQGPVWVVSTQSASCGARSPGPHADGSCKRTGLQTRCEAVPPCLLQHHGPHGQQSRPQGPANPVLNMRVLPRRRWLGPLLPGTWSPRAFPVPPTPCHAGRCTRDRSRTLTGAWQRSWAAGPGQTS